MKFSHKRELLLADLLVGKILFFTDTLYESCSIHPTVNKVSVTVKSINQLGQYEKGFIWFVFSVNTLQIDPKTCIVRNSSKSEPLSNTANEEAEPVCAMSKYHYTHVHMQYNQKVCIKKSLRR